ncbi:MAG TPA: autotransporter-associated beta strand repeat-containing protein [Pseudomonadales bacterium]|nr:autotransporter-associated beta strand repeat-containing protein [Pseudomonadales bacterium]
MTFKIQSPTNVPESDRYWATNNIYHCQVFSTDGAFSIGNTTSPRTEQRFEPDYTNGGKQSIGEIQYQSTEMAPSNENSYCVFQIHTGDAESDADGSTTFMLFWFTNNGGSVHDYSGTLLASNLGNKWFQLNVDHNLVNHSIRVWINRNLVWTQQDNNAGDYYFKDGVYEQSHNPTLQMDTYITNILMWTNSGSPVVPLTWSGQTNGVNDGSWNLAGDTNWVNSTNGSLQFYQDNAAVTFDDSAPGTTAVNLQSLLQPGSVVTSNTVKNYLFTGSGNIGGAAAWLKEGSGTVTDAVANTFTGGVNLNGGIVNLDAAETAGTSGPLGKSGTISFGGGTLQYNTNEADIADYSSRFNSAAGQQYNIDVPIPYGANFSAALSITYASVLSSSGGSLTKNGAGSLILSAANTFTGPITVNNGQLRANNVGAFNSNPITEAAPGTQIYHNSPGTYGGTYSITGYGVAESDGITHLGAIRMATAGVVLANTITLTGNAGISARGSGVTEDAISGQITGNYGIQFGCCSTTTSASGGVIILSNILNNWTGDTTIADGTLKPGVPGVIPNGAGYGNLVLTNAGTGYNPGISNSVFDLNGYSQTINGLSQATGIAGNALSLLWVTNGGSSPVTLTLGNGNANGSFGGIIGSGANALSLNKIGSGTQTLSGGNTYRGNTTINAGKLALVGLGSMVNSPNVIIAGGATFDVSADGVVGPFRLGSSQTLSNSTSTATINGTIDARVGSLALTYVPGTPSLSITNGTLILSAATGLKINNTGAPLGSGSYIIISTNTGGSVSGVLPSSFAVNGSGIAAGATASLATNDGALELVVTLPVPRITGMNVSGTTLTMTATNGPANGQFVLIGSTNLALPLNQWMPILTNSFDGNGNLNFSTNIINPDNPLEFYLLQVP